jgi:hypothetical protein
MAWRIDEAVTHGEIDNTVEGRTTGRIWLAGRDEPLVLTLDGDCWRDLAGTRLRFENPSPVVQAAAIGLETMQTGIVGDITASRKNKVAMVGDEELQELYEDKAAIPFEWKNTLYLEWFSESNGRVLIETASYHLEISPQEWEMDEDAEEAQKLANLNTMRDFMAQVIRRREPNPEDTRRPEELDEYEWEERLKESDRLTDAYQEVLEKYMEDADSERKEAFVMGWDGLLDALADRDESGFAGEDEDFDEDEDEPDFGDEEDEEVDDGFPEEDEDFPFGEDEGHPLQERAQELALRAMDVVPGDKGPGTPAYQLVSNLLQVSGKLAGALNDRGSGYEPETGYVLAVLKRCLNWLNEAVASCQQLMAEEEDPDQLAALARIRSSAFEIRDGITELRRELK